MKVNAFWRKCDGCGKVFMTTNTEKKFCDKTCYSKARYRNTHEQKYRRTEEIIAQDLSQVEEKKAADNRLVAVHCSSGMFWTTKENARNLRKCWVYEDDMRLSV